MSDMLMSWPMRDRIQVVGLGDATLNEKKAVKSASDTAGEEMKEDDLNSKSKAGKKTDSKKTGYVIWSWPMIDRAQVADGVWLAGLG